MIKARYKLLLGLLPFVAGAALASAAVIPAYHEDQAKRQDVNDQKRQNDALLVKLKERQQAERERTNLENDISNLRGAVPKTPELDLFMLDLERMCADSGVDLIGVETPEAETLRNLDASEEDMKEVMDITAKPGTAKPPVNKSQTSATTQPEKNQTALKQMIKQVYVTSDYDGLVRLMHKLETYQRVTGVKQVTVAMPIAGNEGGGENLTSAERGKKLGLHQPVMSFLMTLYYLP
jgi:hypothetical protein